MQQKRYLIKEIEDDKPRLRIYEDKFLIELVMRKIPKINQEQIIDMVRWIKFLREEAFQQGLTHGTGYPDGYNE